MRRIIVAIGIWNNPLDFVSRTDVMVRFLWNKRMFLEEKRRCRSKRVIEIGRFLEHMGSTISAVLLVAQVH